MTPSRLFPWIATLVVLLAVIAGITLNGSPRLVRMRRLDMERTRDLNDISEAIDRFYGEYDALPPTLDKLMAKYFVGWQLSRNPERLKLYEYSIKSPNAYQLCTTFALASGGDIKDADDERSTTPIPHKAGHQCLDFSVAPRKKS